MRVANDSSLPGTLSGRDPANAAGWARNHARTLLDSLGAVSTPVLAVATDHPAEAWRRSGLMEVTGHADRSALVAPVALTSAADGALAALQALAPGAALPLCGAALLGERARLLGLGRRGRRSANGTCTLIAARGGDIAVNLARDDDWDLLPAWLEADPGRDWTKVETIAAQRDRDALVERGRLLGLPLAADDETERLPVHQPFQINRMANGSTRGAPPLVVDLSSLWAGPLAGSLLAQAGARVIKVEDTRRPDGARGGDPRFYDLLNGGKMAVALDFSAAEDLAVLRRLIDAADLVIEASRPRALRQLDIRAEDIARRGGVWLSITAHGRDGEAAEWTGFGDDVAIAAGLSRVMRRGWGEAVFAGDAIADPLTGIVAALAGWHELLGGGGSLVSVPMRDVTAQALALFEAGPAELSQWQERATRDRAPLYPLRSAPVAARALGADNGSLPALLGV